MMNEFNRNSVYKVIVSYTDESGEQCNAEHRILGRQIHALQRKYRCATRFDISCLTDRREIE
jgi:hypothetical protein